MSPHRWADMGSPSEASDRSGGRASARTTARRVETARLTLRPIRRSDVGELHGVLTNREVRRYLLDDELVGVEWVEEEVERSEALFGRLGCGLWAIRPRDAGSILGLVGFRHFFEPPELQLVYALLPSCWGRGLATEAAAAVVGYAFDELGFERVAAATDIPNEASIRVLERLGMELERKDRTVGPAGTVWYALAPTA